MTLAALVISAVALTAALWALLAVLEVHRGLEVVRDVVGLRDQPAAIELRTAIGRPPSAYGLPETMDTGPSVALFLSPRCASCVEIARFAGNARLENLFIVVSGAGQTEATAWLTQLGVPLDVCTFDPDGSIMDNIAVPGTPTALMIRNGKIESGRTVTSPSSLRDLVEEVARAA